MTDRDPEILPTVRASDADRNAVTARLQDAFADGRLEEEEFDVRMQRALSARTRGDLDKLVIDLGLPPQAAAPVPAGPSAATGGQYATNNAVLSSISRKGRWVVPAEVSAVAVLGDVKLDLRAATLTSPVTTIRARAVLGEVNVLVPPGVRVEVHGTPVLGELRNKVDEDPLPPDAPVVRVDALVVLGELTARTRTPGEKLKRRLRRFLDG